MPSFKNVSSSTQLTYSVKLVAKCASNVRTYKSQSMEGASVETTVRDGTCHIFLLNI